MQTAGQQSLPGFFVYGGQHQVNKSAQITKYFHELQTPEARLRPVQGSRVLMSFTKGDIRGDIFHAVSTFAASATRTTAPDASH